MVARSAGGREVAGSNPVAPTLKNPCEIGKNHDFTRVFDLKKKLNELAPIIGFSGMEDKFNVISVRKKDDSSSFFEMTINFDNIDYIKASFTVDENNTLKFNPYIYSEYFASNYILNKNESFIFSSAFPYYFSKNELMLSLNSLNNKSDNFQKVFSRIYVGSVIGNKDSVGYNSRRI